MNDANGLSQPADAGLAHHEMRNFLDFASSNVAASRRRCVAALPCATGKGDTNTARDKQMLSG